MGEVKNPHVLDPTQSNAEAGGPPKAGLLQWRANRNYYKKFPCVDQELQDARNGLACAGDEYINDVSDNESDGANADLPLFA